MTQELVLIAKCQRGDSAACNALLLAHEKWIRVRAKKFASVDQDDLVQEGRLGLLRAIEKFDLTSGVNLLTYADHQIRNRIARWVAATRSPFVIPDRVQSELRLQQKKRASAECLEAAAIALRPGAIEWLDAPIDGHEDGDARGSVIGGGTDPESLLTAADLQHRQREVVREAISTLNEKQRRAFELHYLTDPITPTEEIARELGVSRQRVWQILDLAMGRVSLWFERRNETNLDECLERCGRSS